MDERAGMNGVKDSEGGGPGAVDPFWTLGEKVGGRRGAKWKVSESGLNIMDG